MTASSVLTAPAVLGIALAAAAQSGSVALRLVDFHGAPVSSATVTVVPAPRAHCPLAAQPTICFRAADRTDDVLTPRDFVAGRARIGGIPPGPHLLWVVAPPLAPTWSRPFFVAEDGCVEVDVALPRGASLDGSVVDEADRPLGGVEITTRPPDHTDETVTFGVLPELEARRVHALTHTRARTDRGGRFRLDGLAPGTYHVHARHPERPTAVHVLTVATDSRVTLEPWRMSRGTRVGGRVTAGGAPVCGARVTIGRATATRAATTDNPVVLVPRELTACTDERGEFVLDPVPDGSWRIRACRPRRDDPFRCLLDMRDSEQRVEIAGPSRQLTLSLTLAAEP